MGGRTEPSLYYAVHGFQEWGRTEEGIDFWNQVADYCAGDRQSLPPLPRPSSVESETKFTIQEIEDYFMGWSGADVALSEIRSPRHGIEAFINPKTKKTVADWLETLPNGYRERALAQCNCKDSSSPRDLVEALQGFQKWRNTKEGFAFWRQVKNHYAGSGALPELPTGYNYQNYAKNT